MKDGKNTACLYKWFVQKTQRTNKHESWKTAGILNFFPCQMDVREHF